MDSSAARREPMPEPHEDEHVGVRELRQNLSVYLRRIRAGEAFTVTERGVPVARLAALPPKELSPLQQMIADGKVRVPRSTNLDDLPPRIPYDPDAPTTQDILDELREDRI